LAMGEENVAFTAERATPGRVAHTLGVEQTNENVILIDDGQV